MQLDFSIIANDFHSPARKSGSAGTRYLGSKARIVKDILNIIGVPTDTTKVFIDVFSGTGAVSRHAAICGWEVVANDYLQSSAAMTYAQLLSHADVPFSTLGGYERAISLLGRAPQCSGFIFNEYTPEGMNSSHQERKYFTPENGKKIDGVRNLIAEWGASGIITDKEKQLLLADLLSASNAVANIAGTYGCFLNHWNANSLRPLILKCRDLLPTSKPSTIYCMDAFDVPSALDSISTNSIVYLDPPYTKRQYAAYYHILETIVIGDSPKVDGITGLRPWREKSSPFCYKTRALSALERLILSFKSSRIVLSYSSEGHMSLESVERLFRRYGTVNVYAIDDIGRYRPNSQASSGKKTVTEYLVELVKCPVGLENS